jgi:hypothetical protein
MLNVTRTWNAVCAVATMRRCLDLAFDYARRRRVFGRALVEQPLHRATLAGLAAEFEAAFQLVFFVAELLGRCEHGADADDKRVLRVLTPLAKLWTGKLAVRIASETCEAFGGAGYIEDTGIPQLLRDAQVFPIWEGTTNVLALDALRALGKDGFDSLSAQLQDLCPNGAASEALRTALAAAQSWLAAHAGDRTALEAGARGFAVTLARCAAAALLARHAAWARERGEMRTDAALSIFIGHGLSRLDATPMDAVARLIDNGAP